MCLLHVPFFIIIVKNIYMRAHCLQHVPFEDMAAISGWLEKNNFEISYTRFYEDAGLPDVFEIDWVIVMGGPMSVNDTKQYPWLKAEKDFISECIAMNKTIIGICLGSQLIANSLGCKVYPNTQKEIGWYPLTKNKKVNIDLFDALPEKLTVFHWHGETFDLPEEAMLIASSEACVNQIFTIYPNVIGFQCHFETNDETLKDLSEECEPELKATGKYIQNAQEMKEGLKTYALSMHKVLYSILDKMLQVSLEFM
jgi:GMP synthase-like glutamine amidotransferase